jgi:hypothetical protein
MFFHMPQAGVRPEVAGAVLIYVRGNYIGLQLSCILSGTLETDAA